MTTGRPARKGFPQYFTGSGHARDESFHESDSVPIQDYDGDFMHFLKN